MNPVQAGKFTVAALCRGRTLKLRQPADSHWLDNVSPSFLPPSHPSLLCTIALSLSFSLAISLASAFSHSLSPHPLTVPPPCFCFASVSSLQAGPQHYTAAPDPALLVCLACLPTSPNQEPLHCPFPALIEDTQMYRK